MNPEESTPRCIDDNGTRCPEYWECFNACINMTPRPDRLCKKVDQVFEAVSTDG